MAGSPASTPVSIERGQLGTLGAQLGRGAQAVVHELPSLTLPDVAGALVYKEYRGSVGSPFDLRRIVADRIALDQDRRDWLDEISVWPLRVVEDNGVACGIVMRRIPESFVDTLTLPGTGKTKKSLREVQNLFVAADRARDLGRPVPDTLQRLRICRDFADALSFFHTELSVAFGDVNPKNELYRLDRQPNVMFLDCDGVRRSSQVSGTRQLNAPDWVPPNNEPLSQATDRYKLGLFVLRCLCPGPRGSTQLDPAAAAGVLDDTGRQLLVRALGTEPHDRPTARDWYIYLSRLLGEPVEPPVLTEARIDEQWVRYGEPLAVHWRATDALTVEIRIASHTERVPATADHGTAHIFPAESAYVLVVARNEVGADARTIGPVAVVYPPPQLELPVPMPHLDWPAALVSPPRPALPLLPTLRLPAPVVGPLDLLGARAERADLPPIVSLAPPFDVTSTIMAGPRMDFGHGLPGFSLPEFDQSIMDSVGRAAADGGNA